MSGAVVPGFRTNESRGTPTHLPIIATTAELAALLSEHTAASIFDAHGALCLQPGGHEDIRANLNDSDLRAVADMRTWRAQEKGIVRDVHLETGAGTV